MGAGTGTGPLGGRAMTTAQAARLAELQVRMTDENLDLFVVQDPDSIVAFGSGLKLGSPSPTMSIRITRDEVNRAVGGENRLLQRK